MGRRRKGRQSPPKPRSRVDEVDPAVLAAAADQRAQAAAKRGNPYAWRQFRGNPLDGHHTDTGMHPLDELVHVVDGHRLMYAIDVWPEKWPKLVAQLESTTEGTPA